MDIREGIFFLIIGGVCFIWLFSGLLDGGGIGFGGGIGWGGGLYWFIRGGSCFGGGGISRFFSCCFWGGGGIMGGIGISFGEGSLCGFFLCMEWGVWGGWTLYFFIMGVLKFSLDCCGGWWGGGGGFGIVFGEKLIILF